MAVHEEAIAELAAARSAAILSAEALWELREAAIQARDFEGFERASAVYRVALEAQDKATERLIAGLLDPTGDKVKSLKQATSRVKTRLKKLKAAEGTLAELASALTLMTQLILLFGMI
jgi:hypothetical protein